MRLESKLIAEINLLNNFNLCCLKVDATRAKFINMQETNASTWRL